MSEHVAEQAAFLASLAVDDPERMAAEAHARDCPSCRAALDEGGRLVRLLARAMPPAPLSSERLNRVAAPVEAEIARERRTERALAAVVAGAVVLSWIFQIALDYSTASSDPRRVVLSLGVLGIAITAVAFTRKRRRLALAALVATSGLLAHAAGSVPALEPRIGVACTLWEVVAALIPWTVAMVVSKKFGASFSRTDMMAFAGGGALASQAAQHLTCPVWHADAHLLVFHLGGVLLATLLGALGHSRGPRVSIA